MLTIIVDRYAGRRTATARDLPEVVCTGSSCAEVVADAKAGALASPGDATFLVVTGRGVPPDFRR